VTHILKPAPLLLVGVAPVPKTLIRYVVVIFKPVALMVSEAPAVDVVTHDKEFNPVGHDPEKSCRPAPLAAKSMELNVIV
jgi:hypothetical protein